MIARVGAPQHPADEPVGAVVEDRHAAAPLVPGAARELVHLVARLAAEQLGQRLGVRRDAVDAQQPARPCRGRNVRFLCERQTARRGGSMLVWVAKPTRHPSGSSSARAVTMNMGYSRSPTRALKVAADRHAAAR